MNSKKKLFLLTLILLTSCGGFEKDKKGLLSNAEKNDLVKSFEVSKDQAEYYKEKEILNTNENELKKVSVPTTKKKILIKKKENKASPTTISAPVTTKVATVTKTKILVPAEIQQKNSEFIYPTDYPELLKNYDSVSKSIWGKFKPRFFEGEESIMSISYLGVTAGYITISSKDIVKINDKMAYHYYARFKSKEAYRYFYWLDDNLETFIEKEQFLPIKYALIQREKKQNVDDLELFDFIKLKTFHWYKRVKEGSDKNEKIENYIPRFSQDSFSALQFVRGLPLHVGDLYDFPVVTRGKPWLLKIEVMEEEIISVNGNDIMAFRLKAETHFPGVLQKSGDINFWYSADETRKLLKFQAKVKLGSIYGELVDYKPGVSVK